MSITLLSFRFADDKVSMHVSVTEYRNGVYRVSHSNSVRNLELDVMAFDDEAKAVACGKRLRTDCYACLASIVAEYEP